jgi:hypothetical protein
VDPAFMYYNNVVSTTGVNKYTSVTYQPSTIGSFNMPCQFIASNGFFGLSSNIVGTVASAPSGTQFIGVIIALTFDNSVL